MLYIKKLWLCSLSKIQLELILFWHVISLAYCIIWQLPDLQLFIDELIYNLNYQTYI